MDADFWKERWATNQIGFHLGEVNPLLVKHEQVLPTGGRIFVPLCGKSVDMPWLASRGHEVVGVELVERGVRDFFAEQSVEPRVVPGPRGTAYHGPYLTLWNADLFALEPGDVWPVAGVWDRAALVALPSELRARYARCIAALAPGATMLLVTFVHDFGGGPPFSVSDEEVRALYAAAPSVELIDVQPGTPSASMQAKGMKTLDEHVWRIVLPSR